MMLQRNKKSQLICLQVKYLLLLSLLNTKLSNRLYLSSWLHLNNRPYLSMPYHRKIPFHPHHNSIVVSENTLTLPLKKLNSTNMSNRRKMLIKKSYVSKWKSKRNVKMKKRQNLKERKSEWSEKLNNKGKRSKIKSKRN